MSLATQVCIDERAEEMGDWPAEAKLILSALEAGRQAGHNRRALDRLPFRTKAYFTLHSDGNNARPRILYTRDLHCRGLGFITSERLPLGHGGTLEVTTDDRKTLHISCTLSRYRQTVRGWFEGAMHFNREQDWVSQAAAR